MPEPIVSNSCNSEICMSVHDNDTLAIDELETEWEGSLAGNPNGLEGGGNSGRWWASVSVNMMPKTNNALNQNED
jgi:hypothetical protein